MNLPISLVILVIIFGLAGVGLYGLLVVRNAIKVVVALQLIVKGAVLAFVLAGKLTSQINPAQTMALTVIVADTVVAVLGLALAVQIRLKSGSLDIKNLASLKR